MGVDPRQASLEARGRLASSRPGVGDERLDGARELVAELLELAAGARDRARAVARHSARMSEQLAEARDQAEALEAEWHRSQRDLADARDEANALESRWHRSERDLAAAREQLDALLTARDHRRDLVIAAGAPSAPEPSRRGDADTDRARNRDSDSDVDADPDVRPGTTPARARRGDLRDALAPAMGAGTPPSTPLRALLSADDAPSQR